MVPLVEKELDRLVPEGTCTCIIEPVQFADWAVPMAPVLKQDKVSVRICGDFKPTINHASKLDHYTQFQELKTCLLNWWVTNSSHTHTHTLM